MEVTEAKQLVMACVERSPSKKIRPDSIGDELYGLRSDWSSKLPRDTANRLAGQALTELVREGTLKIVLDDAFSYVTRE